MITLEFNKTGNHNDLIVRLLSTYQPVRFICPVSERQNILNLAATLPGFGTSTFGIAHPYECVIHRIKL